MAQVIGFLLPTWPTQVEFWAPGFALPSSHYCWHLGNDLVDGKSLSSPLLSSPSLCLPEM